MEPKDIAALLQSQAYELIKSLPDYQFQLSAAMTVVLGWLITVESARMFIRDHKRILVPGGTVGVLILLICHSYWLFSHYRRAINAFNAFKSYVKANALFDAELLQPLFLSRLVPISYWIVNTVLSAAIICVIFLVSYSKPRPSRTLG